MRILVTRPEEDAQRTAANLRSRGHTVLIAPLLEIHLREGPEIVLDGVQALVVTSANGIRALAPRCARRDLPVFTVGPQSAQTARACGFGNVKSADGDAAVLAEAVGRWARPEDGALFHPHGAQTRGHLAERLGAGGFEVRGETLYEAVPVRTLPAPVEAALRTHALDAVLLYSPRSARTFREALATAGLERACADVMACCISPATAKALDGLAFRQVRVAAHPDEDGLLGLLG